MKGIIDGILIVVLIGIVAALLISLVPWSTGRPLSGTMLLVHMFASGALVGILPLFAISYLWKSLSHLTAGTFQRIGYWTLVLTGLITIATVFVCMLPVASTEQMHELMVVHSYAGFAMVPALLLLAVGALRWRRIQSTRSTTPG